MNILILGAAGKIAQLVREKLLKSTDYSLTLFAREAHQRIKIENSLRETIVEGDFKDISTLRKAMENQDLVFVATMENVEAVGNIVQAMSENEVDKLIGIGSLGIYNELPESFNHWNRKTLGSILDRTKEAVDYVDNRTDIDSVILRPAWLYNEAGNEKYEITQKGELFKGTQVTREAVAHLVLEIIKNFEKYKNQNIGVSEPNTDGDQPLFLQ